MASHHRIGNNARATEFEFIVVGSGAGGATVAEALARQGRAVLVLERGQPEERLGTTRASLRYYDVNPVTQTPLTSREGVIAWRAFMAGGSTVVACGNAVRCLQAELAALGISLENELSAVERDMGVTGTKPELLSPGSEQLHSAAEQLGHHFQPMPKCLDQAGCKRCGQCVLGCPARAKWTARSALEAAVAAGATVSYGARAHGVITSNGRVAGVRGKGPDGATQWRASTVVLAAGGLETPRLLQNSGIEAGHGLFLDLFVNTYGVSRAHNQLREPTMSLVDAEHHDSEGFLLSPYVNHSRLARMLELGVKGAALPTDRLLGLMTKIVDEPVGHVPAEGAFSKPVTERDRARLRAGSDMARDILVQAGADPNSIVVSRVQGAHPGGTAAIGQVVDTDLETSLPGLYVCDGSVLPAPPGLPPIVTIAALGRRLGAHLGQA
jgi:choline dehydrogenase-like flavoprotein